MKKHYWFILIVLVAGFLRFWHFPANPPSLNWDEVSFGYNAYSVLKTGRDEFGAYLPKYFRSLDDYKMPVYSYLTVASVGIFGLNDFAVRFPSALFGLLTVILVYFLVRELYGNPIALLSAGLLAITPWHVQFSRMAAEATVGLFFFVAGITLFLFAMRKNIWLLPLSVLSFGLSIYSYRSFEVIAPIMGVLLVILYGKQLFPIRKMVPIVLSGILVVGVGVLMVQDLSSTAVNLRIGGTSVFDSGEVNDSFMQNSKERLYDSSGGKDLFSKIFHNNRLVSAGIIAKGYLVHFSPSFWFFDYDQKQHHTPFVGLLYLWMIGFMPVGAYYLLRKISRKSSVIIFGWLLISPIPASVTIDVPHAIRVLPMMIPLLVFTAAGVYGVFEWLSKNHILKYVFIFTVSFCVIYSVVHYFHQYNTHLPLERSKDWVYGRKELVEYVEANKAKYKKVIISTSLEWPHIFFLYYSKYDPAKYLAQGGTISGGWAEERNHYDTYQFRKFNITEDFQTLMVNDTLYAGLPNEFPGTIKPLRIIHYLNGEPAIWIVDKTSFSQQKLPMKN